MSHSGSIPITVLHGFAGWQLILGKMLSVLCAHARVCILLSQLQVPDAGHTTQCDPKWHVSKIE